MKIETIANLQKKYFQKIDRLDLDLIMAHILKKPREFVLAHPEHKPTGAQMAKIGSFVARRAKHEPLAYILGYKEFYGLNFKVTPDTLIPRPETELLVELAIQETKIKEQTSNVIDIGTGSGNIIISIAKNYKLPASTRGNDRSSTRGGKTTNYFATDISSKALKIAKQNAKANQVADKIKFLHGNLLEPIIKNSKNQKLPACRTGRKTKNLIIIANLPYLSREIYSATLPTVKKYEPRSALYSANAGLDHYERLLKQVSELQTKNQKPKTTILLEISPEQKIKLSKIIKTILPQTKFEFQKDLANKWRVCKITL